MAIEEFGPAENTQLADDARSDLSALTAELNFDQPNSIAFFGVKVQRELARISDRMLRLAAGEPVGNAANDLDQMLALIREFRPDGAGSSAWWRRIFGGGQVAVLVRRVSGLLRHMDVTAARLERRKTELLTEGVTLQRLQNKSQHYYQQLGHYEQAARRALATAPQNLRDDLLKRCEDLALSRQIAQQSLAAMAVSQQVTRDLLGRLNSVLDHTLVLWKQHMTQVIAICRGRQTAAAIAELAGMGAGLENMNEELAHARARLAQQLAAGDDAGLDAVVIANRKLEQELAAGTTLAGEARAAAQTARQLLGRQGS